MFISAQTTLIVTTATKRHKQQQQLPLFSRGYITRLCLKDVEYYH